MTDSGMTCRHTHGQETLPAVIAMIHGTSTNNPWYNCVTTGDICFGSGAWGVHVFRLCFHGVGCVLSMCLCGVFEACACVSDKKPSLWLLNQTELEGRCRWLDRSPQWGRADSRWQWKQHTGRQWWTEAHPTADKGVTLVTWVPLQKTITLELRRLSTYTLPVSACNRP